MRTTQAMLTPLTDFFADEITNWQVDDQVCPALFVMLKTEE